MLHMLLFLLLTATSANSTTEVNSEIDAEVDKLDNDIDTDIGNRTADAAGALVVTVPLQQQEQAVAKTRSGTHGMCNNHN
jgi:hypothetical protein